MQPADLNLDDNLTEPLKDKGFDKPFKIYGLALMEGQYRCLTAQVDTKGKISRWVQHYLPEDELEFAQDLLKKILAQDGVRY